MRNNEEMMVVSENDVRTIKIAKSMMNMLVGPAIQKAVIISRNSYEMYQGASAITESVLESGLLPNGLTLKKDSEGKKVYFYRDAYGNYQQIVDVHSFFNDIVAESPDFGFTSDQMAVAFAYGYDYDGQIIGASKEKMKQLQLEAYYALQEQKGKGASK